MPNKRKQPARNAPQWTRGDADDFEAYCAQATDSQLHGIYSFERDREARNGLGASECVQIVWSEANSRGVQLRYSKP